MPDPSPASHTGRGPGRLIVALYGLLALAATGRSVLQIVEYFDRAPVSYLLSALAALIYIVATIGLARGDRLSVRIASVAIVIELIGVLVVGVISVRGPGGLPGQDRVVPLRPGLWLRAPRSCPSSACCGSGATGRPGRRR